MPRRRRPHRPGALADLAPLRIFTQIIVLQAAYYVCAAILIIFTALVAGRPIKLDLVFSWRSLRGDITAGWTLGLAWMLNSLIWYASRPGSGAEANLANPLSQCHLPPSSRCAIQTHSRFRSYDPFLPSHHHVVLLPLDPNTLVLVGVADRKRVPDDVSGRLGVPVAGVEAH
jgi:hypothetical protein